MLIQTISKFVNKSLNQSAHRTCKSVLPVTLKKVRVPVPVLKYLSKWRKGRTHETLVVRQAAADFTFEVVSSARPLKWVYASRTNFFQHDRGRFNGVRNCSSVCRKEHGKPDGPPLHVNSQDFSTAKKIGPRELKGGFIMLFTAPAKCCSTKFFADSSFCS